MRNRTCVTLSIVALVFLWATAGCSRNTGKSLESNPQFQQIKASLEESQRQKAQLEQDAERLRAALAAAEKAKSDLDTKLNELGKARADLETRVNDLTKSRDDLQKKVAGLLETRGALEKQVADLTSAKNAALEATRSAQTNVSAMNDKLTVQTQQMVDLQDQVKTMRSVLDQLKQKLE
jgi:chromosome segregation ATPase